MCEKESDRHRDRQRQRKTRIERENTLKCADLHTWRSENSLWQAALSFHHGVPEIELRLPVLVESPFIPGSILLAQARLAECNKLV